MKLLSTLRCDGLERWRERMGRAGSRGGLRGLQPFF